MSEEYTVPGQSPKEKCREKPGVADGLGRPRAIRMADAAGQRRGEEKTDQAADVDAMVEELRNTHARWYGAMTAERRAEILQKVFHVPAA
jgi:acyl-CoA reductase-like NAD-dependent aldehyde dehydrogenase